MNKIKLFLIIISFLSINVFPQTPHLSGNISFSIKKGTINCDFTLSNIPSIKDYTILINSGFNIAGLGDSTNTAKYTFGKIYNEKSEEAFQYYIPGKSGEDKYLPKSIRFVYTGKFPVISDTANMYDWNDWKGNIAFNGTSLRMTEQSAWYPVLYDAGNDEIINKYTYSINVKCEDCNAEYLNGDIPKKGGNNNFTSSSAAALLLYAGNFNFTQQQGTYFINTNLSQDEKDILSNWTNSIISYYKKGLNIPYGSDIFYLEAVPVVKKKAWLFVTYPTIALVGRNFTMHNLFTKAAGLSIDTSQVHFIAHELGHYYFGTVFTPNAELKWIFLESCTEFLSMQFVKDKLGTTIYKKMISSYIKKVEDAKKLLPLDKVKTDNQVSEVYRYTYIPLLLTALEIKAGKEKMWKWLSTVVKSKAEKTDYTFFKNSLIKSGISKKVFDAFEERYIKSDKRIKNLIDDLTIERGKYDKS